MELPREAGLQITVAVRQQEQAAVLSSKGIQTILISGLDDSDSLEKVACDYEIVINSATGQHVGAPKALIQGLGKRKQNGQDAHFIHVRI